MFALRCTVRVICTVLVEAATLVALVVLGRGPDLQVPVGHLGTWLRDGDPAIVVVALSRWVALAGAAWLLASTLLYLVAATSRLPAAVRAVRWSTLPAVRRAIDAACVVSVATSVVLAPAAASAVRGGHETTTVGVVRDGRGQLAQLPPDTTTPATTPAVPTPTPVSPPFALPSADEIVVAPGDNLWELAAQHVARATARARDDVADAEIGRYWIQVCDANRARLASGDPNLVYPGERVVLPRGDEELS